MSGEPRPGEVSLTAAEFELSALIRRFQRESFSESTAVVSSTPSGSASSAAPPTEVYRPVTPVFESLEPPPAELLQSLGFSSVRDWQRSLTSRTPSPSANSLFISAFLEQQNTEDIAADVASVPEPHLFLSAQDDHLTSSNYRGSSIPHAFFQPFPSPPTRPAPKRPDSPRPRPETPSTSPHRASFETQPFVAGSFISQIQFDTRQTRPIVAGLRSVDLRTNRREYVNKQLPIGAERRLQGNQTSGFQFSATTSTPRALSLHQDSFTVQAQDFTSDSQSSKQSRQPLLRSDAIGKESRINTNQAFSASPSRLAQQSLSASIQGPRTGTHSSALSSPTPSASRGSQSGGPQYNKPQRLQLRSRPPFFGREFTEILEDKDRDRELDAEFYAQGHLRKKSVTAFDFNAPILDSKGKPTFEPGRFFRPQRVTKLPPHVPVIDKIDTAAIDKALNLNMNFQNYGEGSGPGASPRQAPSPQGMNHANGINGASGLPAMMAGLPTPAGHQSDLNYIQQMVEELGTLLAANQAATQRITAAADRVRQRAIELNMSNDDIIKEVSEALNESSLNLEQENSQLKKDLEHSRYEEKANLDLCRQFQKQMAHMLEQAHTFKLKTVEDMCAWHRSYRNQLADERQKNLDLTCQILDMQEHAAKGMEAYRQFRRLWEDNPFHNELQIQIIQYRQMARYWKRAALRLLPDDDSEFTDDSDQIDPVEKKRLVMAERDAILARKAAKKEAEVAAEAGQ